MKRARLGLLLALFLAALVPALRAFVYIEGVPAWPDGTVTLELQLGNSPTYADGTTPNSTAIQAIEQWNPSMARLRIDYVANSGAAKSRTNEKNNVFFDSKIFGTAFPEGVLAVTTGRTSVSGPIEMDVVVNSAWQWDSYRGYLQHPKIDLRRVLAHEFGHVLGLDHPDERGQWTHALMNAYVGEIEGTQQDDKDGASARYGHGPGNPAIPPTFQQDQPWDVTALAGQSVSFSTWVTGTQPIALQWMKDGAPIAGANDWSFGITHVALADAGRYSLRATNTGGTVSSREAILTVQAPLPPTIIEHPQSKSVTHTGSFQISVAASSNALITFQWTKDGVAIPGATASTYGRQNMQPSDAGLYRVIVTTAGGSTTSNGAVITVVPANPPAITGHPVSLAVEEGEPAMFSVGLVSEIPLSFQWMHNDVAIPGATEGWLQLSAVRLADAGSYHVVVTNVSGSAVSQAAILTVHSTQPPMIVRQPESVTIEAGTQTHFTVTATSRVAMTYQWTRDGSPIAGATATSLSLRDVTAADAATYRVIVTNSAGSVTSQPAALVVVAPRLPEFAVQPSGASAEVGRHVYLSAHVRSAVPVTFQWTHNGQDIPGATSSHYYILSATEARSGTYRLRATNAAGSVWSDEVVVNITPPKPPQFYFHPLSQTVEQGAQLSLSCVAEGGPPITYQWYRDGVAIAGATGRWYSVDAASVAAAGEYFVRATNPAGTSTSTTATVTVIPTRLPEIISQPRSQVVEAYTSPRIICTFKSTVPVTVQWTKDGVVIPGATSSLLEFPSVTEEAAGTYVVTITNAAGSVTSNPAVLTILPTAPPRFTKQPEGQVVEAGAMVFLSVQVTSTVTHTIQWTKDGAVVPGATSSSLYLSTITPESAGIYRALATNRGGTTLSQTATIKVVPLAPPTFREHPKPIEGQRGGAYRLYASVQSAVPATYQWYRDGVAVAGGTGLELRFDAINDAHAGSYRLAAANPAGTTLSEAASVTIIPAQPPVITQHPSDTTLFQGASLWLSVQASSVLPLSYQWHKDGLPLPSSNSSNYWLSSASASDSGLYTVVASNSAGSTTSHAARVTVDPPGPPRITSQPAGLVAGPGQRVDFYVSAESPGTMTYQWFKDDLPIPGSTASLIVIGEAAASDSGRYHVVLTNAYGSTTSEPAVLTIPTELLPASTRLSPIEGVEGYYYALEITQPEYVGAFTCQWYRDGIALPGATSPKLEVSSLPWPQTGEYMATITNTAGTVTSTAALVRITRPEATAGGWSDIARAGRLVFLLNPRAARVDRFDLETDRESTPIPMALTPTAIAANATHLYVAFGPDVVRMNHDGTGAVPYLALEGNVVRMLAIPGRLLINLSGEPHSGQSRLACVSLADGVLTGLSPLLGWASAALAFDDLTSRVFAFTSVMQDSAGTRGPLALNLQIDGSFGPLETSEHGNFSATAGQLRAFPGRPWIVDDRGTAWHSGTLALAGSLGAPVDAMDFTADGRLVALRGREISIYDDTLARVRSIPLSSASRFAIVDEGDVVALSLVTGADVTIRSERAPLAATTLEAPPEAPNPATLDYVPDAITTDRDGNLLLLSRWHGALFRWNVREQRYTDAIHLGGRPNHLACIPQTNTVFVGYADQRLVAVDLDGTRVPYSIGAAPWPIGALAATSTHIVVAADRKSPIRQELMLLGRHGEVVSLGTNSAVATELLWNPATASFHFINTAISPNAVVSVPLEQDLAWGSPSTRIAQVSTTGTWDPLLRVAPDGQTYTVTNGRILEAQAMAPTGPTVAPFSDAAWFRGRLYLAGHSTSEVEVRRLDSTRAVDATRSLQGRTTRLLSAGEDRLVLVTTKAGRTHFTLLDAELNVRNHFEDTPDLTKVALTNLSTRAEVGTGDNIMIAGFVVTGSQSKRILVRAVGPGLNRFGVSDTLADPVLKVISDAGPVAENDDWFTPDGEALKLAFKEVAAFSLADTSLDSALVAQLAPGKYTAQVSGKDATQGVALVEAYDLDADPGERRLINISSRAVVGIGDKVLIPGLVVEGAQPKRLLIRAVGPELTRFQVAGVLADPQLRVVNADDEVVAANDNWGEDNTDVTIAATTATRAFGLAAGGRDAALVVTLPAGSYTVVVSGVGDTSGVALVEIYEVP